MIIKHNPDLDQYTDQVLFPEQVAAAENFLNGVGLPTTSNESMLELLLDEKNRMLANAAKEGDLYFENMVSMSTLHAYCPLASIKWAESSADDYIEFFDENNIFISVCYSPLPVPFRVSLWYVRNVEGKDNPRQTCFRHPGYFKNRHEAATAGEQLAFILLERVLQGEKI